MTLRDERGQRDHEIAGLRWHWGGAYEITWEHGMFRAARRDDGSAVSAPTAGHLTAEIRADYQARPIPRSLPPADYP